jgi:hypothetical protein
VPHLFYWKQNSSIDLGNPDEETVGDDGQWAGRRLLKMAGIFDYTLLEGVRFCGAIYFPVDSVAL